MNTQTNMGIDTRQLFIQQLPYGGATICIQPAPFTS